MKKTTLEEQEAQIERLRQLELVYPSLAKAPIEFCKRVARELDVSYEVARKRYRALQRRRLLEITDQEVVSARKRMLEEIALVKQACIATKNGEKVVVLPTPYLGALNLEAKLYNIYTITLAMDKGTMWNKFIEDCQTRLEKVRESYDVIKGEAEEVDASDT